MKQPPPPLRLDLKHCIKFSLWFFLGWLIGKLFLWPDWNWFVGTAPLWSSLLFTMFTPNYNVDGSVKKRDER